MRLILGPTLISLCRRKSIEVKGLSSTGTAHKTAFDTEAEAYNTSESRVSKLLQMEKVHAARDCNIPPLHRSWRLGYHVQNMLGLVILFAQFLSKLYS